MIIINHDYQVVINIHNVIIHHKVKFKHFYI
jgi:hypothetical protein